MNIIPTPKLVEMSLEEKEIVIFSPSIEKNITFSDAIYSFVNYVEKMYVITIAVSNEGSICIRKKENMPKEAYRIEISGEGVTIYASHAVGANHGFATLLQMMQVEKDTILLPKAIIEDEPDCGYRGMMVDLASVSVFIKLCGYVLLL